VVLDIRYPEAFARLLGALRVVVLDVFEILRIDCITPLSLHVKFGIIMLLPVAAIGFVHLFRCWQDPRGSGEPSAKASNRAAAAYQSLVIIFLLYPLLSRTAFSIFNCQTLGPEERWHRDDFSVDCNSSKHTFVAVLAIVGIAVYPVGVPVVFLYLLWRDEQQRVPGAEQTVSVAADSSFHFLRADYKSKYYFYECVILLEKMLLTGLLAFVDQGSTTQAFVGGCIAFAFFAIQVKTWPFVATIDNVLKATAEAQLFVTLFVTVVLRTNLTEDILTADDYGSILIVALMATPSVELLFIVKTVLQQLGIWPSSVDQLPASEAESLQTAPTPGVETAESKMKTGAAEKLIFENPMDEDAEDSDDVHV